MSGRRSRPRDDRRRSRATARCRKHAWPTEREALTALRALWESEVAMARAKVPQRAYPCPRHGPGVVAWHLTSQSEEERERLAWRRER